MKTSSIFLVLSLLFISFGYSNTPSTTLKKPMNTTFDIGGNTTTPPDKSKDMKP